MMVRVELNAGGAWVAADEGDHHEGVEDEVVEEGRVWWQGAGQLYKPERL